jgi:hypothetical protein
MGPGFVEVGDSGITVSFAAGRYDRRWRSLVESRTPLSRDLVA